VHVIPASKVYHKLYLGLKWGLSIGGKQEQLNVDFQLPFSFYFFFFLSLEREDNHETGMR